MIDGIPFLIVGAEVHNSTSSSRRSIEQGFRRVRELGANTVLAPAFWELIEAVEGQFDFTLVSDMLAVCRELGLKLVPLWFGAYKNGMSSYAPEWVKTDTERFLRAEVTDAGRIEHLSPFCAATMEADRAAFRALMAFLAADDDGTVLMVQVENEAGLLGDSRDRSPLAERVFQSDVPAAVVDTVSSDEATPLHAAWLLNGSLRAGSWETLFGAGEATDEAFMATAYASFVQAVAAAGRAEFDIPLLVNSWLDVAPDSQAATAMSEFAGGRRPGVYPSGGPVLRVAAIWRAIAPAIDAIGPDIYFGHLPSLFEGYRQVSPALIIPEMRHDPIGIAAMFLAVGEYGAACVSPFGVDSLGQNSPGWRQLSDAYGMLRAFDDVLSVRPDSPIRGFLLTEENCHVELRIGDRVLHVEAMAPWGAKPVFPAYGYAIAEGPDRLVIAGRGFTVKFEPTDTGGTERTGILSAEELVWDGERLVHGRRLNGDETSTATQGKFSPLDVGMSPSPIPSVSDLSGVVRFRLYDYEATRTA